MKLTNREKELITISIIMRINYIQTGRVQMNANDARNAGLNHIIKNLTDEQVKLIVEQKDLLSKINSYEKVI